MSIRTFRFMRATLCGSIAFSLAACLGGGICALKDGRVTVVGPKHGLPFADIASVACDSKGRIWLARDTQLNRPVALKTLRPELFRHGRVRKRFLQEAQITGQLEHPGIVPVYELVPRAGDDDVFYAMRFVRGRTLVAAPHAGHRHER